MSTDSGSPTINQMPYFAGLSEADVEAASRVLSLVEVAQGEVIFEQGQDGAWVYLLAQGHADISVELEPESSSEKPSERRVVAELSAPALLGEMSMLLDEPRSAWAVATSPCLLWQVSREDVRQALEENHTWAQRLLLAMSKSLASRLAAMNRSLAALAAQENSAHFGELAELQEALYKQD